MLSYCQVLSKKFVLKLKYRPSYELNLPKCELYLNFCALFVWLSLPSAAQQNSQSFLYKWKLCTVHTLPSLAEWRGRVCGTFCLPPPSPNPPHAAESVNILNICMYRYIVYSTVYREIHCRSVVAMEKQQIFVFAIVFNKTITSLPSPFPPNYGYHYDNSK